MAQAASCGAETAPCAPEFYADNCPTRILGGGAVAVTKVPAHSIVAGQASAPLFPFARTARLRLSQGRKCRPRPGNNLKASLLFPSAGMRLYTGKSTAACGSGKAGFVVYGAIA